MLAALRRLREVAGHKSPGREQAHALIFAAESRGLSSNCSLTAECPQPETPKRLQCFPGKTPVKHFEKRRQSQACQAHSIGEFRVKGWRCVSEFWAAFVALRLEQCQKSIEKKLPSSSTARSPADSGYLPKKPQNIISPRSLIPANPKKLPNPISLESHINQKGLSPTTCPTQPPNKRHEA